MTIDRVGAPDPLSNLNKTQKTSRTKRAKSDAIEVSEEAKSKAEVYKAATPEMSDAVPPATKLDQNGKPTFLLHE